MTTTAFLNMAIVAAKENKLPFKNQRTKILVEFSMWEHSDKEKCNVSFYCTIGTFSGIGDTPVQAINEALDKYFSHTPESISPEPIYL